MGPSLTSSNNVGILISTTADTEGSEQTDLALQSTNDELKALGETAVAVSGEVSGATDEMGADSRASSEAIVASNAAAADSYKAVADAATESAAVQSESNVGSDLTKGLAGGAGLASALSNPYVVAGAAISGAIVLMVKSAADFQSQLVKLYDTAGETTPLKTLSAGIMEVADATGESTSQLTAALYFISSAGYNAAGGLTVLKAAAQGAKEENADLTTVANALTTVMHDYGAGTNQSAKYMDELLAATSEGKMTLQDFSSSLSTVLPIAHTVGLSFADVAGAEATLTESGIDAQQATQDLRAVIQGIETPTSTAIKNMQQYGLSSVDLAQNLGKEGLTGTIDEVVAAIAKQTQGGLVVQQAMQSSKVAVQDLNVELKNSPPALQNLEKGLLNGSMSFMDFRTQVRALPEGLTNLGTQFEKTYNQANSFNQVLNSSSPAAQTVESALKGIFTQANSVQGVLALTGTNAAAAADNVKKVGDAANSTSSNVDGWNKQQNTLNQQLSETKENVSTLGTKIGQDLTPPLTSLLKAVNDVLGPLDSFIGKTGKDIPKAIGEAIAGGLVPGLNAILAIKDAADLASKAVSGLKDSFDAVKSAPSTLINDIKQLGIPHFSTGVTNFTGGAAVVGENGPETVILPPGSSVQTNTQRQPLATAPNGTGVFIEQNNSIYSQFDLTSAAKELGFMLANA